MRYKIRGRRWEGYKGRKWSKGTQKEQKYSLLGLPFLSTSPIYLPILSSLHFIPSSLLHLLLPSHLFFLYLPNLLSVTSSLPCNVSLYVLQQVTFFPHPSLPFLPSWARIPLIIKHRQYSTSSSRLLSSPFLPISFVPNRVILSPSTPNLSSSAAHLSNKDRLLYTLPLSAQLQLTNDASPTDRNMRSVRPYIRILSFQNYNGLSITLPPQPSLSSTFLPHHPATVCSTVDPCQPSPLPSVLPSTLSDTFLVFISCNPALFPAVCSTIVLCRVIYHPSLLSVFIQLRKNIYSK